MQIQSRQQGLFLYLYVTTELSATTTIAPANMHNRDSMLHCIPNKVSMNGVW